jgi:NADPH-dependent 2,4-dienoyl-CoA reductase/sulfur reductase-like enzyme
MEDAEAIRNAAVTAERAVLVGAGFVGMELAASLTAHAVRSVVLEAETQVWPHLLPPELAPWMQGVFEDRGVSFRLGTRVEAFLGDGRVEAVRADGQELPTDFAVVGVGMHPCDGLASDAGLAVGDGVLVDAFGETSHPHVYAAGDVARFPDPVFGGHTRVEHWEHAREHGRLVGRTMAGAQEPYTLLSCFFSRVFDLNLDVVGRPRNVEETVVWGDPGTGPCFALGSTGGRLSAVVLLDAPGDLEPARVLVRAGPPIADVLHTLDRSEKTLGELAERYRNNRPPWPAPKTESE